MRFFHVVVFLFILDIRFFVMSGILELGFAKIFFIIFNLVVADVCCMCYVLIMIHGKTKNPVLRLAVRREYFEDAAVGVKRYEFRLRSVYWRKRLEGKDFSEIVYTLGYPKKGDMSRTIVRPWRGYEIRIITHPEFGPDPVEVFAIRLN